jgi:hypothetical protein
MEDQRLPRDETFSYMKHRKTASESQHRRDGKKISSPHLRLVSGGPDDKDAELLFLNSSCRAKLGRERKFRDRGFFLSRGQVQDCPSANMGIPSEKTACIVSRDSLFF